MFGRPTRAAPRRCMVEPARICAAARAWPQATPARTETLCLLQSRTYSNSFPDLVQQPAISDLFRPRRTWAGAVVRVPRKPPREIEHGIQAGGSPQRRSDPWAPLPPPLAPEERRRFGSYLRLACAQPAAPVLKNLAPVSLKLFCPRAAPTTLPRSAGDWLARR